jgi:hypothetical protein
MSRAEAAGTRSSGARAQFVPRLLAWWERQFGCAEHSRAVVKAVRLCVLHVRAVVTGPAVEGSKAGVEGDEGKTHVPIRSLGF